MSFWLKRMGTTALLAGLMGCAADEEKKDLEFLSINSTSSFINDEGQSTQLRVSATDAEGKPGTGSVTLTTPAGFLGGADKSTVLTLDANGMASTAFNCPAAQDSACYGLVRIDGRWGTVSGATSLQVRSAASSPDAGTGTPDAGSGGTGTTPPPVIEAGKPANIIFDTAGGTASDLGIRSVGLRTSTPVTFTVLDYDGKPVANTQVTFSVVGPAGVSLVPSQKKTDNAGRATTVLQSGDEVGVTTVSGSIKPDSGGILTASTPAIPIVGARVSDRGLVVECNVLNLSANMTETPPHKLPTTTCTAHLSDRFANPIVSKTTVTWYSEAGAVASPVQSEEAKAVAVTTFSTAGKWPPVPVEPLVKPVALSDEPKTMVDGVSYNPRDMLVTLIAVTAGEEEFYDGSGTSKGIKNGQWDKGEWFVDTPEPFVDANDNQIYDYGETYIDTERRNCETGEIEPKNGKWDGPNGCWDGSTMLWRPTHIVYSGYSSYHMGTLDYTPAPPTFLAKEQVKDVAFLFQDAYHNIISPEGAATVVTTTGGLGSAELVKVDAPDKRDRGFQLFYEQVEVSPDSSQPRGYKVVGPCDYTKTPASGASTDAKLARCVWQYRFGHFSTHTNWGVIRLRGAPADSSPGVLTVRVAVQNQFGERFHTFDVDT